ncbi:MAG TPA: hypothetical protein VL737_02180 [Candidatus Pristimantibacillus sp.]|nr:hypothetical protein [Candidatus Pristimantibacillus sp.]
MTTYDELFPRGADGFAHREASLALAENLSPSELMEQLGLDFGDPIDNSLHAAWTLVEYAQATPEHAGDSHYFGYADRELAAITGSGIALTDPRALNARLLQASLPGFRSRAQHETSVSSRAIDRVQAGIGQVLLDYLDTEPHAPYDEQLGRISEIIAMYGVLLARRFPFLSSPREERNRFVWDNHDSYVIDNGQRVPFSVKHVGPLEDNPLVVMLRVGVMATEIIRDLHLRVPADLRGARDRGTWWLVDSVARNVRREVLEKDEITLLTTFAQRIEQSIADFRTAGYSQTSSDLGDLLLRQSRGQHSN